MTDKYEFGKKYPGVKILCHVCGRDGRVMRPVDPPGTDNRRWACSDHAVHPANPDTEEIIAVLTEDKP
jgi:hypothetical protein